MEMSPQSHLTYRMEQGHPPSDILCSTDISKKTMGQGGFPPIVVVVVNSIIDCLVTYAPK